MKMKMSIQARFSNLSSGCILIVSTLLSVLVAHNLATAQAQHEGHDHAHDEAHDEGSKISTSEAWIYALISSVSVSLLSLLAVVLLSLRVEVGYSAKMGFVGLGAGSMLGTALLTLVPESVGILDATLAGGLILVGVFAGMVIEIGIHFIHPAHEHILPNGHCENNIEAKQVPLSDYSDSKAMAEVHNPSLAWNNVIGDGLHNFADGVLMGLVYLSSAREGLLVTLAVVFHEIPQELGDYFVLIHSGWSKKRAVLMNLASALMAVVGAVVGLLVGESSESVVSHALPIIAGQFLYISLSQLLPELVALKSPRSKSIAIVGFLVGIGVIGSLLSLPEEWGHSH